MKKLLGAKADRDSAWWLVYLLLAQMLWLMAGCTSTAPDKRVLQYLNTDGFGKRYSGNAEEENYVTLGDTVVFGDSFHPELSGNARVDIDGTIIIPEAGPVHVAGLTRSEIEGLLTQKLSPYYEQNDIQVQVAALGKFFYIVGESARQGPQPFRGDLTILEAVLVAAPIEHTANLSRVQLIRPDPRDPFILSVDISDMLRTGDSTYNVHVQESDIIYIPPTILKKLADFLSALVVPFSSAFSSIIQSLLFYNVIKNGTFFGGGNRGGGFGGGGGFF